MMMNYDTWKTTNPTDLVKPVCQCEQCEADIYSGQDALKDEDGNIFCDSSCMVEYILESGIVIPITA